jgi:hypothetical protein
MTFLLPLSSPPLPPPQVLIFVHSRKETAKTARHLKDTALANEHLARFMRDDSASREILQVGGWVLGVGGGGGGGGGSGEAHICATKGVVWM